ncbi:hypothetical protein HMPREF0972_00685 [Actinomyces sp. oral taxon 848 str. F0332]|nr:hypothetical protein HMPREF0972_00685 [Actinomyces sp. oral taxon 848 str. F0332]
MRRLPPAKLHASRHPRRLPESMNFCEMNRHRGLIRAKTRESFARIGRTPCPRAEHDASV